MESSPANPAGQFVDIEILPNGNLKLKVDQEEREDIEGWRDERTEDMILSDLMESHWTNGSFTPFSAGQGNPFVGLTDAPCIAEAMIGPDDDGKMEIEGRLWWFPNYAVQSTVDVLLEKGEVVFQLAPGYEVAPSAEKPATRAPGLGR